MQTKSKNGRLEQYRRNLEKFREEIVAKMQRVASNGREENFWAGEPSDSADVALKSYTKEFLYKLSDVERRQLLEIEAALRRIREGSYGECIECGSVVPPKRLDVIPWAARCTPCQEVFEQLQESIEGEEAEQAANF
ncbi:MAG: TraR/DksA family transcriptional regulator [Acidobacteria bacterium]|nr:TraR/DksA family transcriptional regulator [Acidobacteriota bacterium]